MRLLILVFSLFALLSTNQAQAGNRREQQRGTQSGGGTDVLVGGQPGAQDDVIIDFAGREPNVVIDPRQYDGIYNALIPKLDRLDYYHPGFKLRFERVFKKTWRMTLREFQPRRPGEARTIEQTEDYVDINFTWFKTTTVEQKQQAWLHEMVREFIDDGWVNSFAARLVTLGGENRRSEEMSETELRWLADEAIQQLTPLIYFEENNDELFAKNFMKIFNENIYEPWDFHRVYPTLNFGMGTRVSMYQNIKRAKLRTRYETFCHEDLLMNLPRLTEALERARRNKAQYYDEASFGYYFTQPKLVELFTELSYILTSHSDTYKGVFRSDALNNIAYFAVRTTSAIEARATMGTYEFRSEESMRKNILALTNRERQKVMQAACKNFADQGLIQILDEYDQDGGVVRNVPPARPILTNQTEVEDALNP